MRHTILFLAIVLAIFNFGCSSRLKVIKEETGYFSFTPSEFIGETTLRFEFDIRDDGFVLATDGFCLPSNARCEDNYMTISSTSYIDKASTLLYTICGCVYTDKYYTVNSIYGYEQIEFTKTFFVEEEPFFSEGAVLYIGIHIKNQSFSWNMDEEIKLIYSRSMVCNEDQVADCIFCTNPIGPSYFWKREYQLELGEDISYWPSEKKFWRDSNFCPELRHFGEKKPRKLMYIIGGPVIGLFVLFICCCVVCRRKRNSLNTPIVLNPSGNSSIPSVNPRNLSSNNSNYPAALSNYSVSGIPPAYPQSYDVQVPSAPVFNHYGESTVNHPYPSSKTSGFTTNQEFQAPPSYSELDKSSGFF